MELAPAVRALSLLDLEHLVLVARAGSISAAAGAAGYSQSAMSRRIARVEAAAGGPAFVRSAAGLRPTAAGERLLGYAVAVLAAAERARTGGPTGAPLRLGAFTTATAHLVPAALRALATTDPDVRVTEATTARLLGLLRRGDLDAAVVSDYPSGTPPARGVGIHHLADDPLLVALPADHPRGAAAEVALADLAGERWIESSADAPTVLQAAARAAGFTPAAGHEVREWTAKLGFVAAGLGVTIVPRMGTAGARTDVVLVRVPELGERRVDLAVAGHCPPDAAGRLLRALRAVVAATALPDPGGAAVRG